MEIPQEYRNLIRAIEEGDTEGGVAASIHLHNSGHTLADIFRDGIVPSLKDIGDRFGRMELFLPEMMRSAEVVRAIHRELGGKRQDAAPSGGMGKILIGTVFGDVHDIGKNIVATMFEVNGFEVFDLGVSVAPEDFVRRARELDVDIIAMSSLLTTSTPYMGDVIQLVRANTEDNRRFKILVGGGPVTADRARELGADGYGENAAEAVKVARRVLGEA